MTVLLDYLDAWVAGDVTDRILAADCEVVQLTFERTWKGSRTAFNGATVARVRGGLILGLREYQTTAALSDWRGTWR